MEDLELKSLKILKKKLLDEIIERKSRIKIIVSILDTYKKCYLCKIPYEDHELFPIKDEELKEFKEYDEENYDNDSCYNGFQEDELYCKSCIEKRLMELKIYNSININETYKDAS